MTSSAEALPKKPRSFEPPEEPAWHRMIAEAAYHLAEKRGFSGERALDDWLAAEQQIRSRLSRDFEPEETMNTSRKDRNGNDVAKEDKGPSRFEKFAATQAAGDGIQGDPLKKAQTAGEKIGANMADRK
jgi:Protein of unknown function (DUF2934)